MGHFSVLVDTHYFLEENFVQKKVFQIARDCFFSFYIGVWRNSGNYVKFVDSGSRNEVKPNGFAGLRSWDTSMY